MSTRPLLIEPDGVLVSDRQDRLTGFSTGALGATRVLLIGAGGIGGAIAGGLIRKGVGRLEICDPDTVEIDNLNRQHFYASDLTKPKAFCLAQNAAREGALVGECVGHYVGFTRETADSLAANVELAIVAVDHNASRTVASRFFRQRRIPCVLTAVNEEANFGWVFVQQAVGPCLGCVFPRMAQLGTARQPCRPVAAVLDILRVMGGIVLYAVDSLVMDRPRHWNFRSVHLAGEAPDCVAMAQQRADCPLCAGGGE